MVTALVQGSALAGHEWCAEDPVFQVLGAHFRITTSVNAPASSVSSITYDVTLPSDAQGAAAVHFPQGRRLPAIVNLSYTGATSGSSFPVTVTVTVSASEEAVVVVDLSGPDVAAQRFNGTTSSTTVLQFNAAAK